MLFQLVSFSLYQLFLIHSCTSPQVSFFYLSLRHFFHPSKNSIKVYGGGVWRVIYLRTKLSCSATETTSRAELTTFDSKIEGWILSRLQTICQKKSKNIKD